MEIKWPNDIYYKRQIKLGGILVTAFTIGADTTATIGEPGNTDVLGSFPGSDSTI